MRNLKRFLAMTLTMLMVVSCFSFASFAQSFDDVSDYAKAIDTLTNLGVIWGYEDGTFGSDDAVARWHMSLWIAKMETGKVSTDDYLTVWKADGNYTAFTDVTVDQAIGAINYASDEGIIKGTSATTFAPEAGITYQDALTMVVRALGYGSSAMDAGYPWKYINKAAELGLEDGISGIAYKQVLTRAETAQILFNALSVVDANGDSYIKDVFGLTTVVITGTNNYKMSNADSVIKTGYVAFNLLNADGSVNTAVTYYAPASEFGIEAAKADNYVGASFQVTSDNNFKTLGTVIANPSEVFDAAKIVGKGTAAAASTLLTLGEDTYEAVDKYSSLYNAQGIKGNTPEILVYTTNELAPAINAHYKVDALNNVLDANGKIVAYYAPYITGSYATPYVDRPVTAFMFGYVTMTDAAIKLAGGVVISTDLNTYKQIFNTYDLVANNKYATAVAYDDNADGVYDRLFYTYQAFSKISADATTTTVANDFVFGGSTKVVNKFIDGKTGEALTTAPTGYIRYSYDVLSKYLTVYETYTFGTGLVTTVNNIDHTIIIGGTKYTAGIATYAGANFTPDTTLIGKQVNFILADGIVICVFDGSSAANTIVIDRVLGITTQGYATALAYVQSNQATVINIATINGYSLFSMYGYGMYDDELYTGTKDALGFWHLSTSIEYNYSAIIDETGTLTFTNGIGVADSYIAPKLNAFSTNADTVYIVYDGNDYFTAKGVPVNNSVINVYGDMFVEFTDATNTVAKLIYVDGGYFTNFAIGSYTSISQYDSIIYVGKNSTVSVSTDSNGLAPLFGYTWTYSNVFDMTNGKFVTVTSYYQLEAGQYYTVSNGLVRNDYSYDLASGTLTNYDLFSSTINGTTTFTSVPYIFELDVNGNVICNADGTAKNFALNKLAPNGLTVIYYTGEIAHNTVYIVPFVAPVV